MKINPNEFSFFDHLDELRGRLVKAIIAIIVGCIVFYRYLDAALYFLVKPVGHLVFTSPPEAFTARMMLMFLGGTFLALPYVIYQLWQFIGCALAPQERKYVSIYGFFSVILFIMGIVFAYFLAVPYSIQFLLSFSSESMVPMITVKNYISYVGTLLLGFGVVFELPLILMFLTRIGIATPEFLIQKRRHAIILILIVSAIITPPDVVSQLVMALPLIVLYEIGIFVCKLTWKEARSSAVQA